MASNEDANRSNAPSPEERQRHAAAVSHLLGEIGLTTTEQTRWWNLIAHTELGGRTATQAWLAGDTAAVEALVQGWYAKSASAARRVAGDAEFLVTLREKLAELDERIAGAGPLHQSA